MNKGDTDNRSRRTRSTLKTHHECREGLSRRFEKTTDLAYRVLSVAVFIAAVACVASLIVYLGFDGEHVSRKMLRRILSASQLIFIFNILFCTFFKFTATWRSNHPVRRIADIAMIMTIIPKSSPDMSLALQSVAHFFHSVYYLYGVLGAYSIAEICYGVMSIIGRRTNPSLMLSASFLFFIFLGSFILMMPRCTTQPVSYVDSFFMAASAVSMTGLTTVDVPTVYSPLGWAVIAILMQIGALGVLTFTSFFAMFFSGTRSIYSQLLIRDFIYSKSMSALIPVMVYILIFTAVIEALGAVAIYFSIPEGFMPETDRRIFFSIFHSMSGFCNGGFTTLPHGLATPALMAGNGLLYFVMTILILAGGIGFPNLVNFKDVTVENIARFRRWILRRPVTERRAHVYDLNTKLVLVATAILFFGGAVFFFIAEYNGVLSGMPLGKKIIQSFFNSAAPRTAGFSSISFTSFSNVTFLVVLFLMWIGCSSQSMGGGIKVNTFMAVLFNLRSIIMGDQGVTAFKRNIALPSVRRANAVICFFIFALVLYSGIIMALEPDLPFSKVIFECFSAITTVGYSFGITPELGAVSKIVLASAMFLGRVGIISVLSGVFGHRHTDISPHLPTDNIIIS